ncbi:sigma-70 family RNA polymerase sigma factor [Clostridium gasigenes]|uniref:sigma factor n=1 Tax=Clostridium gasigenes TaxID=94869 RepID=UPI001438647D|nr:sigma factor [Clostridium gasigenes]NKF05683.1 sigma-70 family RNA polymerase sigma factor [Clostridium gasigenes]QSW19119.1 sigma-70 family RNA polymerase sigma factor [Clostridium gasigenes]
MKVKFNKNYTDIKQPGDKDDVFVLLTLSKNGDKAAKELLIKKYYALIVFQTKGIYLNGYTFDDLVQTGIESVLKSINNFDISKGIEAFNSYVFFSIKNNFNYLCRKEIKYNEVFSLNTIVKDDMESIDFIPDTKILEEVIIKTITSKELLSSLKLLDKEELELIRFLYLDEDGEKEYLSNYAKVKGKDYYYCTSLKKRALSKLRQRYA